MTKLFSVHLHNLSHQQIALKLQVRIFHFQQEQEEREREELLNRRFTTVSCESYFMSSHASTGS